VINFMESRLKALWERTIVEVKPGHKTFLIYQMVKK
jgi:hypothetical protein